MTPAGAKTVPAWVRPTVRVVPLAPLAAAGGAFLLVGALARLADGSSEPLLPLAAAGTAAALVAGLHDPAAALLAAVPASAARRRGHRLAVLLPAGLLLWTTLLVAAHLAAPTWGAGWPFGPVTALAATGVAVAVWAPPEARAAWGAAAPMLWFAVGRAAGDLDGPAGTAVSAWQTHPWAVVLAALAAITAGGRR